jgi:hypothetical protein
MHEIESNLKCKNSNPLIKTGVLGSISDINTKSVEDKAIKAVEKIGQK